VRHEPRSGIYIIILVRETRTKAWSPCIGLVFIWPLLSSYSRIYLAAHYPGDVLVGWMVGSFAAVGLVGVMIYIEIRHYIITLVRETRTKV
jgi:membrane-associated phospholipid phosphatase